jgi:PPOX class probable F420-dependent enzyme
VRLDADECWRRVTSHDHGVLATVHAERGVDVVPVVFAIADADVLADPTAVEPIAGGAGRRIVVPVDTVKPKAAARLQRLVNVEHDPRCALLVEHYDADWEQLWWVRVHARAREAEPTPDALALLAARHEAYRRPGSVSGLLVLEPEAVRGWSAT